MRPPNATSKRPFSPAEEARFLHAAREYALHRYPNPDRKGCPTTNEIAAIARREIPLYGVGDRAEHIATCSPCLSEYLAVQESWKRRRQYRMIGLATAAALTLGFIGVIWLRSPIPPPTPGRQQTADAGQPDTRTELANLDLRPLVATRGERAERAATPVLTRANLRLKILLPVGSEEGDYQYQVRDEYGAPQLRGAGRAIIREYVTTIDTTVDLRPLNPGRFTWVIRRTDQTNWHSYRIEVR